jgi:hypothetical protein
MCYQSFISDAWVHAYISVQNICALIRLAGKANRAVGKERALQQKFAQYFSFKIHLFLQNVLQNIARSTSNSVTFSCFCYFIKISHTLAFLQGIILQHLHVPQLRHLSSAKKQKLEDTRLTKWIADDESSTMMKAATMTDRIVKRLKQVTIYIRSIIL